MKIKYCLMLLLAALLTVPFTAQASPEYTYEVKPNGQLWLTVNNPEVGGNYTVEISLQGASYGPYTPLGQTVIGGKPVFVFAAQPTNALVRVVEKVNTAEQGVVTTMSTPTLFVGLSISQYSGIATLTVEGPPDRSYTIWRASEAQGPYTPFITGVVGHRTFLVNMTANQTFFRVSYQR